MKSQLTCTMCGYRFDPTDQAACSGCPIQPGCVLVRCPACGFESVNPENSHLAGLAMRFFGRRRRHRKRRQIVNCPSSLTLGNLPPEREARVLGFLPGLSTLQQAHLQAYGLSPGCLVWVVRHEPVTIVKFEHMELALESQLANSIQVSLVE